MTTPRGSKAVAVVTAALDAAGVGPDVSDRFRFAVTLTALLVIDGTYVREEAIDLILTEHDLARPFVTKALDLAVEALTATEE